MSTPRRRGALTLSTLGRGFWIGIAASLALHAALLSSGTFKVPRLDTEPALEARLEGPEFKAIDLPAPDISSEMANHDNPLPDTAAPAEPEPGALTPSPPAPAASETAKPLPDNMTPKPAEAAKPDPSTEAPQAAQETASAHTGKSLRELPAHIEIVYELRGLASGKQTHVWQKNGSRYTLETEATASGLAGVFVRGKMVQKSAGRIGPHGLIPEHYEMLRLSGKRETLQFNYPDQSIESDTGKRKLELPLVAGTQDPLSSIYQLAMMAQDEREGTVVAASAKRVKGYPYRSQGEEILSTPLGDIKTLRVTRAGDSDKGAVQLWLAVDRHYLPVKVTYTDDDGVEWVLMANAIHIN